MPARDDKVWKETVRKERQIRDRWERTYGKKYNTGANLIEKVGPDLQKNLPSIFDARKVRYNKETPVIRVINTTGTQTPKKIDSYTKRRRGSIVGKPRRYPESGDVGAKQTYIIEGTPYGAGIPMVVPSGDYYGGYKPGSQNQIGDPRLKVEIRCNTDGSTRPPRQQPQPKVSFRNLQYPVVGQFDPERQYKNKSSEGVDYSKGGKQYSDGRRGDQNRYGGQYTNTVGGHKTPRGRRLWFPEGRQDDSKMRHAGVQTSREQARPDPGKYHVCRKKQDPGRRCTESTQREVDPDMIAYYFICCYCGKEPFECDTVRAHCFPQSF